MNDLSWMDRIACAGMDPKLFYPRGTDKATTTAAKSVCERCPVRAQCDELRGNAKVGIWAGTSSADRKRKPPAPKPKAPPKPKQRPVIGVDVVEGPNGIELVPRTTRNERGAA